ncbi:MAG TPA: helix-turn-helix domain-containing protein [Acidimicrobiales bacterium]|nr:helix-turn-helix domain-containing protein [Acidimicrobiales bacterium]
MTEDEQARTGRSPRADALRNRARLVDAATQAFAEHGVDASLEDVARRAGVGIGTLYRHFPTRDSLVAAVYRHEVDVLCESADELLATLPPDQALAAWMQRFVGHVAVKRGMASALKSMMGTNTTLFEECRREMNEVATRLLGAAAAAGGVRDDISATDLLRAMGGICLATDNADWPEQARPLVALLLDGLRYGVGAPSTPDRLTASG